MLCKKHFKSLPGGQAFPKPFNNFRSFIANNRFAPSAYPAIKGMIKRLAEINPPVLPMDTTDKLEAAARSILFNFETGTVASKTTVETFKKAIVHWHFEEKKPHVSLFSEEALMIFKAADNMHITAPKNKDKDPVASHGHRQLPQAIWEKTVWYWLNRIDENHKEADKATFRDTLILILAWVMCRRQGDIFRMTRDCIFDQGNGRGFVWLIKHAKKSQNTVIKLPIPETTDKGIPVGNILRLYLDVAPKTGFIFRQTTKAGKEWCDPFIIKKTKAVNFQPTLINAGFTSGAWNGTFRKRIAEAVPEFKDQVQLFSLHSCRSGAAKQALDAGMDRALIQQMLSHKDAASLMSYTRASNTELARAFAATK